MCKHILNAQVSMRAPCCKKWYDCRQCHDAAQDHELRKDWILIFGCKKCKHVFRKDMRDFEPETDGFCPSCDNEFFIDAQQPHDNAQMMITLEGDANMQRDSREKQKNRPGQGLKQAGLLN